MDKETIDVLFFLGGYIFGTALFLSGYYFYNKRKYGDYR